MTPRPLVTLRSVLLLACAVAVPAFAADPSVGIPKRGNPGFFEAHASFLRRAQEGPVGVLFLGDSITAGWTKVPALWESAWGRYQPANFGIGGDQTQHVIWRIEQAELENISPKVVVLMIGTNNTGGNTAEEITAANHKIVTMIQEALPETKILLLAIFPRGPRTSGSGVVEDGTTRMAVISAVNAKMATWDDGDKIRYLDIGHVFLDADGNIPLDIMPDRLHPNAAGYQLWVDAMSPLLAEMMQ